MIKGENTMDVIKEWLNPPIIWFAVGLVLTLLEFANPGVVIIFFGVGAWLVALICLFFDISINAQLMLFLITSILLLISLRRWFKDLFHGKDSSSQQEEDAFDEYFGKKAVVKKEITPGMKGKIEFQGTYWDAESYETIPEGETVEIINKKNITFTVKPL